MRKSSTQKYRKEFHHSHNYVCFYCRGIYPYEHLVIEHVYPVSHGGFNEEWNFVSSCYKCNSSKGSSSIPAWLEMLDRNSQKLSDKLSYIIRILEDREEITRFWGRVVEFHNMRKNGKK